MEPFGEYIKSRVETSYRLFVNIRDPFAKEKKTDGFLELITSGEWTEAYVFLRLLGDGRIYSANANLQKDENTYIDILNIVRDEPDKITIFERFVEDRLAKVKAVRGESVLKIVTAPELTEHAKTLYEHIKNLSAKGAISVENVQSFLESMGVESPKANLSQKAKLAYGAKTDIILTSRSSIDRETSTGGFSIKSHLGSSPTLFNSSSTSGFRFEVEGCDEAAMHRLNALGSFLDIMQAIMQGFTLSYLGPRNDIFGQNIGIVDSRMDEILKAAVLVHAGYYGDGRSTGVKDICSELIKLNPTGARNPDVFYPAKFKDFLFASFAGMTATTEWDGRKNLTGGYIDVSRDGELLYYKAMSDEVFGNYLFKHTFFDRPDRGVEKDLALARAEAYLAGHSFTEDDERKVTFGSSGRKPKKGDFGYVYEQQGKYYIDINFQIRFR